MYSQPLGMMVISGGLGKSGLFNVIEIFIKTPAGSPEPRCP
jgi:hypothetical protein